MMAAAITTAMGIPCTLVIDHEIYARKNKTREKLEARGVRVTKEYPADRTPPEAGAETPLVVLVQVSVRALHVSIWKAFADRGNARFFSLPHQLSNMAWRSLEDWVSRALVSPTPITQPTDEIEAKLHRALADLKDRDVVIRKTNETIDGLRKELDEAQTLDATREALAAKVKGLERMIVESNRERDGLKEQLSAAEKRANSAAKMLAEHTAKWNREREELVAAKEAAETAAPPSSAQAMPTGIDPAIIAAFAKMIDLGEMTAEHAWTRVVARAAKGS